MIFGQCARLCKAAAAAATFMVSTLLFCDGSGLASEDVQQLPFSIAAPALACTLLSIASSKVDRSTVSSTGQWVEVLLDYYNIV